MPVLKNDVIKSLTLPRLPKRHQAALDELMQRFSRIITDINALESKFLEYQATPEDEFLLILTNDDDKRTCIDHICHQISKQSDLYSYQSHFKHIAEFSKFLLLILHSNSYCESIFSTTRKICTDGRHNLVKDAKQGHASTSG